MKNTVIFSVDRSDAPVSQNRAARMVAEAYMSRSKIDYKVAHGSYQGTAEIAYIVDSHHAWVAETLATAFNQESIISVGDSGNAVLRTVAGDVLVEFGPLEPTRWVYDNSIEIDGKQMSFYPRASKKQSA